MAEFLVDIPWAVQKEISMTRTDKEDLTFLKPNIVECIKQKLGEEARYKAEGDFEEFTFPDGRNVMTLLMNPEDLPDEFKQDPPINVGDFEPSLIVSNDRALGNRLYEILQECAIGRVSLPAIQSKVAAREGKKGFRAALGMRGKDGTGLPLDVARLVGKMSATKTLGGKRKPTRKTKKAPKKKTLKRHR